MSIAVLRMFINRVYFAEAFSHLWRRHGRFIAHPKERISGTTADSVTPRDLGTHRSHRRQGGQAARRVRALKALRAANQPSPMIYDLHLRGRTGGRCMPPDCSLPVIALRAGTVSLVTTPCSAVSSSTMSNEAAIRSGVSMMIVTT